VPRSIGSGFGVYIMVKIFIGNTKCKLDNLIDPLVKKAIDLKLPDVSNSRLRQLAIKLKAGGVGYYPRSGFIHVDSGQFRTW